MIYNLHNFFEKIFFCKKVLMSPVTQISRYLPQNFALEQTKEHLYQVTCFFSVLKYHKFFSVNSLHYIFNSLAFSNNVILLIYLFVTLIQGLFFLTCLLLLLKLSIIIRITSCCTVLAFCISVFTIFDIYLRMAVFACIQSRS